MILELSFLQNSNEVTVMLHTDFKLNAPKLYRNISNYIINVQIFINYSCRKVEIKGCCNYYKHTYLNCVSFLHMIIISLCYVIDALFQYYDVHM